VSTNNELIPLEDGGLERFGHRPGQVVTIEAEGVETPLDLARYWRIVLKRRWAVLTVALVLTTVVAMINFRMKPVYEAKVRVEVESEEPQLQSLNDFYRGVPSDEVFLRTQVQVLESDSLAWQTIQQMGLTENSEYKPPGQRSTGSPVEEQTALVGSFRDHLKVELIRGSRMLELSFESRDPHLAAAVANGLVSNYAEYNFRKRYNATRQASGWMEQQLDELKAKVEKSQQALVDYERQNSIVNVGEKQNVEEQRLAQLSNDFTNVQSTRLEKESYYELVKSNESQVAFIAQSEALGRLETKYADLQGQLSDAEGQYGPNYPKVLRLKEQVDEIQSLIERECKRIVARIRNDYVAALGREKLLAGALAQEKDTVGKLNQLLIQHNLLKREFDTNQQLYDSLLQHLKDATVSAGLRATNIHVVDRALPPPAPVRPKKKQNIAMGFLAGMALGVILALMVEVLDSSIKSPEDVERLISVPALAVIPHAVLNGGGSWLKRRKGQEAEAKLGVELTVLNRPGSPLAESYRALRTSILLSTPRHPPQVLLVTSSQPNEGKSCTSLNLALTLAQRGGRVALIDADLRKPGVAALLGLANGKGLSSILTGAHTLEDVMQPLEALPNLKVVPGGPRPPNPADLLSSSGMKEVLGELRERFDHVVVDSPPVLLVTDATILSTLVDGIVLVVESGVTVRGAILRTHKVLGSAGGKVLGVVLNKADSSHDGYYGSYSVEGYNRYYVRDKEQDVIQP
jgi:capsular exopolysaccharide synthesis family protein